MYPNNIKVEKASKIKIIKAKLKYIKDEMKSVVKYLWHNRKQLNKILMIKLHI